MAGGQKRKLSDDEEEQEAHGRLAPTSSSPLTVAEAEDEDSSPADHPTPKKPRAASDGEQHYPTTAPTTAALRRDHDEQVEEYHPSAISSPPPPPALSIQPSSSSSSSAQSTSRGSTSGSTITSTGSSSNTICQTAPAAANSRIGVDPPRTTSNINTSTTTDGNTPTTTTTTTSPSSSSANHTISTATSTATSTTIITVPGGQQEQPPSSAPQFPPVGPFLGGGPRNTVEENRTTLWIGDLERWEDEEYIFHFFNQICPRSVVSVKIARDREQQRSLGYGFIDFSTREIAEQILSSAPALKRPHGRRFKLTWARGKTRQPFNPTSASPTPGSTAVTALSTAMPGVAAFGGGAKPPHILPPQQFMGGTAMARWCVEIPNGATYCNPQRIRDMVLKPMNIDNVSSIETMSDNENSLRINFTTSTPFFAFIGRYQDGCFELCGAYIPYTVPGDVMDRWTRMYEQSVESPPRGAPGLPSGTPLMPGAAGVLGGAYGNQHVGPPGTSLAWQRPFGV